MRRRRVILGLAALALAAVLAVVLWPRGLHPCRATFDQVREGMAREEVVTIVGGPPGDYSAGDRWMGPGPLPPDMWLADDGFLLIQFDRDGRADAPTVHPFSNPHTLADRLRARLGL